MNTREKILNQALESFNERGIEYVGLRELAAELGMRVSNITYYFPTKDDLVFALSEELSRANAGLLVARTEIDIAGFLAMCRALFANQYRFRCLLLSVVHLMNRNPLIAAGYPKNLERRRHAIRANLTVLSENGQLKALPEPVLEHLVSLLSLLGRFWISEAAIAHTKEPAKSQQAHYLGLIAGLLLPHATAKGRKALDDFQNTVLAG